MYNIKIKITYILLLFLCCCNNNDVDKDQSSTPDQKKISENFLIINSSVAHIDNTISNSQSINISFDSNEMTKLSSELDINIVPSIESGADKISLSPNTLKLKLKDVLNNNNYFQLIATGAKVGGNIKIKFKINGISQQSEFNTMLSHREIKSFDQESMYTKNTKVQDMIVYATSDAPDDEFKILFTGLELSSLTSSCTANNFVDNLSKSCKVNFTIIGLHPKLIANIDDESKQEFSALFNVCDADKETLFVDKKAYSIDYTIATGLGLPIKISRCTNNLRNPLSVKLNFQKISLNKGSADKTIEEIIGVKDSVDNTISFPVGAIDITAIIANKLTGVEPKQIFDNFRYILPSKISILASAANYISTSAELDNTENTSPEISLNSDIEVDQNSYTTVQVKRRNIDSFIINFCLASQIASTDCDHTLDGKYTITENIAGQDLKFDIVGKALSAGNYYLLGFLNTDKNTPVQILEHNKVTVHAVESIKFMMKPELKHILSDFPSYYYLAINNGEQKIGIKDDKLYLYALNNSEAPASNCSNIKLYKVNVSNPTSESICILGSTSDIGSCFCDLNSGLLSQNCVFRVDMSGTKYNDGDQCQLSVRTNKIFNEKISKIQSTTGLTKINIQTNSNLFPSAGLLEMYNDNNGHQLNDWRTSVTAININDINGDVFNDATLFEMKSEYFSASGNRNNNSFIINNYPGRNAIDRTIQLPNNINFVLGWAINNNQTWQPNRCAVDDQGIYPPHLGCYSGGGGKVDYNSYRGNANIPGNFIQINKNDGIISFGSQNLNLQPGWLNRANQVKLGEHSVSRLNNNTINLNIHQDS